MRSGPWILAVMIALSGCAADGESPTPTTPEWSVAADPKATADDVVAHGKPVGAVTAGGGELLVLYRAASDDDEGPQVAAWQIRSAQGEPVTASIWARVREASPIPSVLRGIDDGFLLAGELDGNLPQITRVGLDGKQSEARVVPGVTTTRPGDVQLYRGDLEWFYRPSDQTVRRFAPPVPFPDRQQVLITHKGTPLETTAGKRGLTLHWSGDGGASWKKAAVPSIKGAKASRIFVGGGRIWAGLIVMRDDGEQLQYLISTPEKSPGVWERHDLRKQQLRDTSAIGEPEALADGSVVLGDRQGWWMHSGQEIRQLQLPDGLKPNSTWVGVEHNRLWAGGPQGSLFFSEDFGSSWTAVA